MAPTDPIIGAPLAESELPDADALVREAGWNQVAADWEIFRALGTVHAARADGRVVATAAILPYGGFAWISMVLVAGTQRRKGLGTDLLKHCVAELRQQGRVPVLDATPAGRPIYRSLGFQESWGFHRLERARPQTPPAFPVAGDGLAVGAIGDPDWSALCAYDARAFGADRSALRGLLRGRLPPAELVARRDGRIAGFVLGRDGRSASQIGPLVAEDDATAQALLARALAAVDVPVYVDFADSKVLLLKWLAGAGFTAQRPFTRMLLGRASGFDDEARTFAVAGPEFG
jgi:GNAT superfamily N-acetyltransferase